MSAPSLFISRGNRGSSFPLAGCCYFIFKKLRRSPLLVEAERAALGPPLPPASPTPSTSPTTSAMAPKADKGKGVKSAEA